MDREEAERVLCACGKTFVQKFGSTLFFGNLAVTACGYHCAVKSLTKYQEEERTKKRGVSGFGRRRA